MFAPKVAKPQTKAAEGTRRRVSSLRLIVITVIPRHPTSLMPTVARDMSIGEAGDVSIGDLQSSDV